MDAEWVVEKADLKGDHFCAEITGCVLVFGGIWVGLWNQDLLDERGWGDFCQRRSN